MTNRAQSTDEAVSPVVGVILVVAITVILSTVVGAFVFNLGQSASDVSDSQSSVAAQVNEKPDGVYVTIVSTDSQVDVLKNGAVVHTFSEDDVGATLKVSGLSEGDSVSLRKNGSSDSIVMRETVESSISQSGDGAELVSGGTNDDGSTTTYTLAWDSSSDWDAATNAGVEHSSLINAESVRIGRLEDDGDVSEFAAGDSSTSNLVTPAAHDTVSSSVGLGPYARHVQTNSTSDVYTYVYFNQSREIAPDKTVLWVNIPKPDTDDWVFNAGFKNASGGIATRIAFDGGGSANDNGANVATLHPDSGWVTHGDYPANTWFKVVVDWDWANNEFELFVNGTSRGTNGFRANSSGYLQYYEKWDYRNGGIDGYIDHQTEPYVSSGALTTAAQTTGAPLNVSTVQLQNVSHTLNGQGITAYVESDPDGDGTYEETSDPITLDGSSTYDVTGLTSNSDSFRIRVEMSSDNIATPQLNGLELTGDEA